LTDIHFSKRLEKMAVELDKAGDNRSAQILNQLWEILLNALEQLYDVLGETYWEPEAFQRLFMLLLSQYDVGTIPTVLDAVTAGPVSAMRCQQTKHLFVLGAAEGLLPGYGGSKGVLTDQERVALRKLNVPLTGGALEGIQAEFAEVYGVFCGAQETICISCSSSQPSYIYRRLLDMIEKEQEFQLQDALPILAHDKFYLAMHHGLRRVPQHDHNFLELTYIRRGTVDRLVHSEVAGGQACRRKHADGSSHLAGLVGQDVPEDIARDDNVELLGFSHQLHGGVVNIEVVQLNFRIFFTDLVDHPSPKA
jgi:hypothetical protein